jgi:Glutamyl- and glutaminyl-tRNA synthetases
MAEEINELTNIFFDEDCKLSSECQEFMCSDEVIKTVVETFKNEISNIDWTIENISTAINNTKEKANVKGKMLFMPIRISCSKIMHGPELADTIYLLGKEKF